MEIPYEETGFMTVTFVVEGEHLGYCFPGREFILSQEYWHPCLEREEYIKTADEYVGAMLKNIPADGMYLDEFGNGTQYHCFYSHHPHGYSYDQIAAEKKITEQLQGRNPDKLWMCEFPPVDEMVSESDVVSGAYQRSDTKSTMCCNNMERL